MIVGSPYSGKPGPEEVRWIVSEDANAEHLLDIFTATDATSDSAWRACADFMKHLCWYKPWLVTLGRKVEALVDDRPSKPGRLVRLSQLLNRVANHTESKQLFTHASKLSRERGTDRKLAQALKYLSHLYLYTDFYKEGIRRAEEATDTAFERTRLVFVRG